MIIFSLNAGDVILGIVVIILMIGLSLLMLRGIIKDYTKNKNEKLYKLEGVISRGEMKSLIATYMVKSNAIRQFSLIYIDLDKFEDFHLAFGEKETKNILINISKKIKDILPDGCYISRFNKDDFLVFLPDDYARSDVLLTADQILKSFRQKTNVYGDESIDITASIAVASYPSHGNDLNALLQSLTLSIYKIKKEGGNALKVYSTSLDDEEKQMNYYYQIKNAIAQEEFRLQYQPVIKLDTKEVYSFEALLRWQHADLGLLTPNKFINIMEQSGDIHWVGQWSFEKVVKLFLELRQELNEKVPLISLNLTPKQLLGEDLVDGFQKTLKKYKLDGSNFILEIGEFALYDKQPIIIDNIQKLKKLNFNLSIDGLGVDLIALSKLVELSIDEVKIDYSFISEDTFVVKKYLEMLIDFSEEKGKNIIIQKVDSIENENRIKQFGLNYAQGYHYSKAIEPEELVTFINNKQESNGL